MGRKILLVEDDRETAAYLAKGLTQEGHSVEQATERPGRPVPRHRRQLRPHHPRPHAAGARRAVGAQGAARRANRNAGPDPVRAGLGRRPDRRPRMRVRRLSGQALLVRRAAGARERAAAAARSAGRPGRASPDGRRPRDRPAVADASGAAARSSTSSRANICCSNISPATKAASSPAPCCSSRCGTITSTPAPTSSTSMSAGCGASSRTGSKSRCCTRCAARATCSRLALELIADHRTDRAARRPARAGLEPRRDRLHLLADPRRSGVRRMRRQVIEQGKVLADVYRTGGMPALDDAIEDTITYGDPQTAVAPVRPRRPPGRRQSRSLPRPAAPLREGYRNGADPARAARPRRARRRSSIHRLPRGEWLVSGRIVGDGLALRDTLERSLLIALVVAGAARPAVRRDPRPLCRPPDRRDRRGRRPHQRARPDAARPAVGRRRRRSTGSASRSTRCSTGSAR